ncbi:12511_t:CDS:1, partial [Gigaspora rosea]
SKVKENKVVTQKKPSLNTSNNSYKAAETTKKSEDSREINSKEEKGEDLQVKELEVIKKMQMKDSTKTGSNNAVQTNAS